MWGMTKKSPRPAHARRRSMERLTAATLLALAAALAWGAGRAGTVAEAASCPAVSPVAAGLRQQVIATRTGPQAYVRFGHGTPLLLITGYRATVSEWNSAFVDALAADHDVIVLENPGVGRSVTDHVPQTMEGMADTVSDFIDAMRLRDVDVLGWSMGGMVVQQLAIDHPHQVHALVLMSTTAAGSRATPVSSHVTEVLSGTSPAPFDAIMGVLFPPDAQAQAVRCFRSGMFQPAGYGHVAVSKATADAQSQAMAAWWRDDEAFHALSRISASTLVLVGDKDAVLPPQNASLLAATLPHATLAAWPDGGHAVMYQDPQGLAASINRFLAAARTSRGG